MQVNNKLDITSCMCVCMCMFRVIFMYKKPFSHRLRSDRCDELLRMQLRVSCAILNKLLLIAVVVVVFAVILHYRICCMWLHTYTHARCGHTLIIVCAQNSVKTCIYATRNRHTRTRHRNAFAFALRRMTIESTHRRDHYSHIM